MERDLGPIDVLVTNTGGPPGGDPLEFTREQWEAAHRELVVARDRDDPAGGSRHARARLRPGAERLLGGPKEPIPGLHAVERAPARLLGAFKLLAKELAGDGITLNTILPGRIATDRISHLHGSIEKAQEVAREQIPARRLGTAEEIAAAAAFLCSERASYITGTTLLVDGGLTNSL